MFIRKEEEPVDQLVSELEVLGLLNRLRPGVNALLEGHGKRQQLAVMVRLPEFCVRAAFGTEPLESVYAEIAEGKTGLSFTYHCSTRELLSGGGLVVLRKGMPYYPGGVWRGAGLAGFAVGASGVDAEVDEAIANQIADGIVMIALNNLRLLQHQDVWFIGDDPDVPRHGDGIPAKLVNPSEWVGAVIPADDEIPGICATTALPPAADGDNAGQPHDSLAGDPEGGGNPG